MKSVKSFNFKPRLKISNKYVIIEKIGQGWEGELYLIKEIDTQIERVAKFFYPRRNPKNITVRNYAKKLHRLRECPSLIKYIARDVVEVHDKEVTYLLSDYIEGFTLDTYIASYHYHGIGFYEALHIFYALVQAVEEIHLQKESHGDLHTENVIIQKVGLKVRLKLIDVFIQPKNNTSIQQDIYDLCFLLYEIIGGSKTYKDQPKIIKSIVCGNKRGLISKKFKNATHLKNYLENNQWID